MELRGPWRIAPIDAELTRTGADPDLDDSSWPSLELPGHWGDLDGFDPAGSAVLHRLRFRPEPLRADRRRWIHLDGVVNQADIWLDGHYLGDTEGPHVPASFDVTDRLDDTGEHLLAVEVTGGGPGEGRSKRTLTGSLQTGPLAPAGDPGGVWRPVRLVDTGPVAIRHRRLTCISATTERAELALRLVLDADAARTIRIDTTVVGPDGTNLGEATTHELAGGENRIDWTVVVPDPDRWWPATLGDQPRYDVMVTIRCDDEVSDRTSWRTGLRSVEVDDFRWTVNGETLFVKGVVIGPTTPHLGSVDPDELVADLRRAADLGLDLVRIHGHVTRPEVYDAADELGLLVWQDLPFVGGYATTTRALARIEAREIVDRLAHHPAVALWCVHDEPNDAPVPDTTTHRRPTATLARHLGRHLLPSWNRSVLDPLLRRELRAADPSRAVVLHSGGLPSLADANGSDPHLWLGWRTGSAEDLGPMLRRWPSLGAFLGGFGAQSATVGADRPDGPTFSRAETAAFERTTPRSAFDDPDTWAVASQAYQAELVRHQVETIRRLKYRPAGGFCVTALADHDPAGGFGIFDRARTPKAAHEALSEAARPVIVVADRPPTTVAAGTELHLDVHVVSDRRAPLGELQVTARATGAEGAELTTRRWTGRVDADEVAFIATWTIRLPDTPGRVALDLVVEGDDVVATNRYDTVVVPADEVPRTRRRPGARRRGGRG